MIHLTVKAELDHEGNPEIDMQGIAIQVERVLADATFWSQPIGGGSFGHAPVFLVDVEVEVEP